MSEKTSTPYGFNQLVQQLIDYINVNGTINEQQLLDYIAFREEEAENKIKQEYSIDQEFKEKFLTEERKRLKQKEEELEIEKSKLEQSKKEWISHITSDSNKNIDQDDDKNTKGKGKRFDKGKIRVDLLPSRAVLKCAQVFTFGAEKYGERNWEKGMKWSRVLGSLERHFQQIKMGEDYDEESGLLHIDHVTCNALFLSEYYETYLEGDDRPQPYMKHPKIGLDIDEVLADFIPHYNQKYDIKTKAESWNFDPKIKERLKDLSTDDEFWLTIPVKTQPKEIPFEPACYITSRSCKKEITEKWLHDNGFPHATVYHVGVDGSKVECAKEHKIDWYVDDRYKNFIEMTEAGILCFLWDASHNQRYSVGKRRIHSFKELPLFH